MRISYILKCKLATLNMYGCVVYQKLSYLYMRCNACLLAAKACMHVAYVFQELKVHDNYAVGCFMMCSWHTKKGQKQVE